MRFSNLYNPSKTFFLSLILLFALISKTSCQRQLSPQAQKAVDLFNAQQFDQALSQFKVLTEKYPKDPLYHFYLGASLVETNQSSEEAIYYLKMAQFKNSHPKVSYYLAHAYYRQFRFDEALQAYKDFIATAKRQDIKELGINDEVERIAFARNEFSNGIDLSISVKTKISVDSILPAMNEWLMVSDMQQLPTLPVNANMFVTNGSKLDELYYSAPQTFNASQRDIFRIKKNKEGKWSAPENLGNTINTSFDEDYPVYIEKEKRLYFASKGHKSLGGYDIFTSIYSNGNWSAPEQLPFPINSPWDDYLFAPGKDRQLYLSNRDNKTGQTSIYQIESYEKSDSVGFEQADEMLAACFKKANKEKAPVYKKIENKPETVASQVTEQAKTIKIISSSERIGIISEALKNQKVADSLLIQARKIKLELNNTEGKEQRSNLFSSISKIERNANVYQEKANELYTKALESVSLGSNTSKTDSTKTRKTNNDFRNDTKLSYTKENPIPFDVSLPEGIIYRIQLGAFSKSPEYERFGGLKPLSAESLQDGKIIKYYVGVFSQFENAEKALKKVKESSFKEAFIVSYLNNKKIPIERAKELEKTY